MNKISFFLKAPKSDKPTAIYLFFRADDGPLKYYPSVTVLPTRWDTAAQMPVAAEKGVRATLARITAAIEQLEVDCRVKGSPFTRAAITACLDALLHKQSGVAADLVYPAFEWAVQEMYAGRIVSEKTTKRYSQGSVRTIENAMEVLRRFQPDMRFSQVTQETYLKFIVWAEGQEFTRNYTGMLVIKWKTLMRATEGRYHNNMAYKGGAFKKIEEEVYNIYLTDDEIAALANEDFSANPRWQTSRDWFVLGCRLGMRVNDLLILEEKNHQEGFITVVNEKTDVRVVIPVHPQAAAILKRRKGFPPAITDVELGRTIKDICKHLKFNAPVIYSATVGGKRKDYHLKKWQMVSTHTMRRTFITTLLKQGIPESIVMKLAGIKSYATLRKYNKMSADDAARIAAEHKYFKG